MEPLTADLKQSLLNILLELDREVAELRPTCDASGRCCRFVEYDHTLFLSEIEAKLLLEPGLPSGQVAVFGHCPFQIDGLCTARDRRPSGCRVYFCDPKYADAMPVLAERVVQRLKQLHDDRGEPWNYRPLHEFLGVSRPVRGVNSPVNGLAILDSTSCRT